MFAAKAVVRLTLAFKAFAAFFETISFFETIFLKAIFLETVFFYGLRRELYRRNLL